MNGRLFVLSNIFNLFHGFESLMAVSYTFFMGLRKEYVKETAIRAAIALAALSCIAVLGSNDYGARTRGDTALAGIAVGIPLYILYRLLVMKRALIAMRQQQLATMHPALRELKSTPKIASSSLSVRLIPLLWGILLVVAVGVFFAIWWTGR